MFKLEKILQRQKEVYKKVTIFCILKKNYLSKSVRKFLLKKRLFVKLWQIISINELQERNIYKQISISTAKKCFFAIRNWKNKKKDLKNRLNLYIFNRDKILRESANYLKMRNLFLRWNEAFEDKKYENYMQIAKNNWVFNSLKRSIFGFKNMIRNKYIHEILLSKVTLIFRRHYRSIFDRVNKKYYKNFMKKLFWIFSNFTLSIFFSIILIFMKCY